MMNQIDTQYERFKLFINEPTLRKGKVDMLFVNREEAFSPKKFNPKEAILRIVQATNETKEENLRKKIMRQEEISLEELRNSIERVTEFQSRVDSLERTTTDFEKKVDDNIASIHSDEKKITRLIETLNTRFQNLSQLYEKIQTSKRNLEEMNNRFGTIKLLTDENIDLKAKLTRMTEEKTKVILERPILRREELNMLENDVFNLRNQNESLKRELNSEKERNLALVQENSNLTQDRRDLIDRLQLNDDERKNQLKEYRDLLAQKTDLERRLMMRTAELESIRNSKQNPVDDMTANPLTMKKLMDQNEKLIQEINVLKTGRVKPIEPEQLQNPDAKKLFEAHQKAYELEKKNLEMKVQMDRLHEQIDYEKTLNSDLNQKYSALEYKYQQLQIEANSLKNPRREESPFSTPRRIFDVKCPIIPIYSQKDSLYESPRPLNQSSSPKPRTTIGDMARDLDKSKYQQSGDSRMTDIGTSATRPRAKIF